MRKLEARAALLLLFVLACAVWAAVLTSCGADDRREASVTRCVEPHLQHDSAGDAFAPTENVDDTDFVLCADPAPRRTETP